MTKTQIKSLEHILQLLEQADSHAIRQKVIDVLTEHKILSSESATIEVNTELAKQFRKVKEAKEWIKALLSDSPK